MTSKRTLKKNIQDRYNYLEFKKKKIKSPKPHVPTVLMITSFPPRECGIATYSKDLVNTLKASFSDSFNFKICALNNHNEKHEYSKEVTNVLDTDDVSSFDAAAQSINGDASISLIIIQHEFGLFRANRDKFLSFLEAIEKPKVVVFHTVLPSPDVDMKEHTDRIIKAVNQVVVMTNSSKKIVHNYYKCPSDKIKIIPHGTHLVLHKDGNELKKKYGLKGKTILATFGLLGPGKSIETTLDALPRLLDNHPDIMFLIIGKTHPTLIASDGERYRDLLVERVKSLKLENHVKFVNEFLPLNNLLEYLQLTDIYLFTSNNPHQAVSGTFAYALSCGCPIISTPIPHAVEVLNEDKGLFFEFGNSDMLSQQIEKLLADPTYRQNLGLNGIHTSSATAWENSAISHAKLFSDLIPKHHLRYNFPKLKLDHLKKMTTSMGIIQFSKLNHPDISSGYTLDDNARALIIMSMHYRQNKDEESLTYIEIYLDFILNCQRYDGTFMNYVNEHKQFTEQNEGTNLQDSNGRAIWALGQLIALEKIMPFEHLYMLDKAEEAFNDYLPEIIHITSPRAMAFIIKGLYDANHTLQKTSISDLVEHLGNKLSVLYTNASHDDWKWFENYFTYGNSVLPQAMLMAYKMTHRAKFERIAIESFDFLLKHLFKKGRFRVISNQGWFERGNDLAKHPFGGQQAIDVAYTILALRLFHTHQPQKKYDEKMQIAFSWFLGNNHLNQSIYNSCTGGCYDGIETSNVNLNQGAESLISYLLSRLAVKELEA